MAKNKYAILVCHFFGMKISFLLPKANTHNVLISRDGLLAINKELLKNPFVNCNFIKTKLNLVASVRTIRRYVNMLGWRRVEIKYC